ncbi:hypothetical protein SVIO_105400 [Streptomyces violaceusniger]|uniref:Uncharacterized protein n=1 Tax=Streptomyces violaceusniger TaxID=68280 RepID=A0A4D4LNS4_STRVO|nr:hypothetical protein SVIO_105400 [Streptomyces violaceusniger]
MFGCRTRKRVRPRPRGVRPRPRRAQAADDHITPAEPRTSARVSERVVEKLDVEKLDEDPS